MKLSCEDEEIIKQNNAKISRLLTENEAILKKAGFRPPEENYALSIKGSRIHFPNGYIRKKQYFVNKYCLNDIIIDKNVVSNIAYSLQMSDMNNYIMNRFNTFASIETMLHKQSYFTIISVLEALVLGSIEQVRKKCSWCKEKTCKYRISKGEKGHVRSILKKLSDTKMIQLTEDELMNIDELFLLRKRIHLISSDHNEMLNATFGLEKYNLAIMMMKRIDDELVSHIVPMYGKCMKEEKESHEG